MMNSKILLTIKKGPRPTENTDLVIVCPSENILFRYNGIRDWNVALMILECAVQRGTQRQLHSQSVSEYSALFHPRAAARSPVL